ncbi:HNH endonuclease [Pseudomonas sp. IT-194MI4]|uniref:HNH endonuclease n=1 Tax=Pseudomonas sp. IT-194MI4 TaxID=3026443 RepID=UPI0039E16F8C
MSRNFVSEADAAIALDLALRVESGQLRRAAAFNLLTTIHQFAPHTANAYLNCYPHLRRGTPWKATVAVQAVRVILETIATGGANDLLTALQSVKGHMDYFAGRGKKLIALQALFQEFQLRLAHTAQISHSENDLENRVRASSLDDPALRRQRLALATKKPKRSVRIVHDYYRNADVIAEVLDRAQGVCEGCGEPAPFSRRSNGTAYLEVHHLIRLADNGDDTVENAIALCPNCHRHKHFG